MHLNTEAKYPRPKIKEGRFITVCGGLSHYSAGFKAGGMALGQHLRVAEDSETRAKSGQSEPHFLPQVVSRLCPWGGVVLTPSLCPPAQAEDVYMVGTLAPCRIT